MKNIKSILNFFLLNSFILLSINTACTRKAELAASININGSSTVFPITEAVAEEFQKKYPTIKVSIGVSGTGGGFKKFIAKETDINNASRRIKASEIEIAKKNFIDFIEIPVAHDGIVIVVNKKNTWVDYFTTKELKKIWSPESKVKYWSDIRTEWPKKEIRLYGPGTDSGTFDYFTKVINGKSQVSRSDFTKSEDDNVLVKGVIGDEAALGYFGFAYYLENKDKIRAVAIDAGTGPVEPSDESISTNAYKPLSRYVFIYVNKQFLQKREEVYNFVKFYIENSAKLAKEVGYTGLTKSSYENSLKMIENITKNEY